jgi:ferredoxin
MAKDVKSAGFKLIEAHALHVPENFPPLIKRGTTNEEAPNINELEEFKVFIESIDNKAKQIYNGGNVEEKIVRGKILFKFGRKIMTSLKVDLMGEKEVHKEICTSCSLCSKGCSYGAIKMVYGHPEFDETKCESCYTCFNRCPSKAIYTKKFDGVGHYLKPHSKLVKKLKV